MKVLGLWFDFWREMFLRDEGGDLFCFFFEFVICGLRFEG